MSTMVLWPASTPMASITALSVVLSSAEVASSITSTSGSW